MKQTFTFALPTLLFAVAIVASQGACNDVGTCPAAPEVKPGGACSGDTLECPYTLRTPSPACDGTTVQGGIATSCICVSGTWSCPSPISCDAGTGGP
jgi:hypothetical protein